MWNERRHHRLAMLIKKRHHIHLRRRCVVFHHHVRRPLALGDRVAVQIEAERVGRTSFTLRHRFVHTEHGEVAVVRLTHVAIHVPTRTPVPLPGDLAEALRTHLVE